jgi:iron uptake system component EfeO
MLGKLAIALTIGLACVVLVSQAWAASTRTVTLRDNFITLSSATAPHGAVTFSVTNRGREAHNFNIKRVSTGSVLFRSARLRPGVHISVTRSLAAGAYRLYCTLHAGMTHSFTVN